MRKVRPSILKHLRDIILLPFIVTVVVPYIIHSSQNTFLKDGFFITLVGIISFVDGLALFLYSVILFFFYGRGTLAPWSPTQKLVIRGPYKYCRNPMITGVFLMLIGEGLIFHSINILIWAAVFFVGNTLYFIYKEEPDLEKRFGDEYRRYKQNVPRWIPRLRQYTG